MSQRILVLSFHAPPESAVGGLRWAGLSSHLAARGWQVRMITAAEGADDLPARDGLDLQVVERRTTVQDRYRRWRKRRPEPDTAESNESAGDGHDNPANPLRSSAAAVLSFPDHGRGWILRAALATRKAIREWKPGIVVSTGPPHSVHLAAGLGLEAAGTGIPWLVDLRDPWHTAGATSGLAGWSLAATRLMERSTFRRADAVLTTTPELRDRLARSFPSLSVQWLPNGVDTTQLPAVPERPPSGLDVTHLGNVYFNRDPGPVLRSFARFLAATPAAESEGARLRFVGHISSDFVPRLNREMTDLGIADHVDCPGMVPRDRALEILASSHVALVLAQGQNVMVPAKLYEAIAMGLPTLVVTEPESATAKEARRLGASVHEPEDEAGMAAALARAWSGDWNGEREMEPRVGHAHLAGELEEILRDLGPKGADADQKEPDRIGQG